MTKDLRLSETIPCDVLIIGGGGAGLRCAAEIMERRPQTNIVTVTKVAHVQKSHTVTAQGGVSAVDPRDPADKNIFHMFDTWKGSDCTADQEVIQQVVESAWEQIIWLENHGMHFSRDEDDRLARRTFGGHTINFGQGIAYRVKFEADRTGKGIIDAGWWETLKAGVRYINQSLATELIIEDGRCLGAVLFLEKEGRFVAVLAKATIVATGGLGQVYKVTSNCRGNTGDGLALALAAGLPVMDLEAVQFHPTGIVGPGILASEALRGEGGVLRNKDGERFMERYAPTNKDLAPRDIVSRAIETEIREGRTTSSSRKSRASSRNSSTLTPRPNWPRSDPPATTRWAAFPPTARAGFRPAKTRSSRASLPLVSAPRPASTASTGWAPTPSWS